MGLGWGWPALGAGFTSGECQVFPKGGGLAVLPRPPSPRWPSLDDGTEALAVTHTWAGQARWRCSRAWPPRGPHAASNFHMTNEVPLLCT